MTTTERLISHDQLFANQVHLIKPGTLTALGRSPHAANEIKRSMTNTIDFQCDFAAQFSRHIVDLYFSNIGTLDISCRADSNAVFLRSLDQLETETSHRFRRLNFTKTHQFQMLGEETGAQYYLAVKSKSHLGRFDVLLFQLVRRSDNNLAISFTETENKDLSAHPLLSTLNLTV